MSETLSFDEARAMLRPDAIGITLGQVPGSGEPPQWRFEVRGVWGQIDSQMTGPRNLVLQTLSAWVLSLERAV